jgi:hypothetical protein
MVAERRKAVMRFKSLALMKLAAAATFLICSTSALAQVARGRASDYYADEASGSGGNWFWIGIILLAMIIIGLSSRPNGARSRKVLQQPPPDYLITPSSPDAASEEIHDFPFLFDDGPSESREPPLWCNLFGLPTSADDDAILQAYLSYQEKLKPDIAAGVPGAKEKAQLGSRALDQMLARHETGDYAAPFP